MKFIGVDLHKKNIVMAVMIKDGDKRKVLETRRIACSDTAGIRAWFEKLGPFQVVVEATSCFEWFFRLIEDLADRCVLAHPKSLRVIAESKNKSDKIDAKVLAEFLLLDMIPESWRPTPRVHEHRVLVRHRDEVQKQITSVKCRIRYKAAYYNADMESLFSQRGLSCLKELKMSDADRFACEALLEQLLFLQKQLQAADQKLHEFAKAAALAEQEARAILYSMPCVGDVTVNVVVAEVGDFKRFRSAKKLAAYAGLDPGIRRSDERSKQLHITKDGSKLLRWVLVETAWRLVTKLARWKSLFQRLVLTTGHRKKAIVAVARHVLCVMHAMVRDGRPYNFADSGTDNAPAGFTNKGDGHLRLHQPLVAT